MRIAQDSVSQAILATQNKRVFQMRMRYSIVHSIKVATYFVPETFGRLTILGPRFIMPTSGDTSRAWVVCECTCGEICVKLCRLVVSGHTKSCGCYLIERIKETHTKHGHSKQNTSGKLERSPEYEAYHAMMGRCYCKNHSSYSDYGGRGIGVWDTWRGPGGFERWLAEIGPKPHPKMTQERKDVNKGYEPGNVCWATSLEQANNTRANIFLTLADRTMTISQWAEELGIVYETLYTRHKAGWSDEKALTTKVRKRPPKPKIC